MELKATDDNGKTSKVSGFQLAAGNVLFIDVDDKTTVNDNIVFTRAITTDSSDSQKAIGITSNCVIDFSGYAQGLYTLDVVANDDRAYEAIIVIGQQSKKVVDNEITKVNNEWITEIELIFEIDCGKGYHLDEYGFCIPNEPEPMKCDIGFIMVDSECKPQPEPQPIKCGEGEELIDGKCEPIIIDPGWCPVECTPIEPVAPPLTPEPEPEPEPIECGEGEKLNDGKCVPLETNPVEPISYDDPVPTDDAEEYSDNESEIVERDSDESEDEEQDEESGESDGETSE
jgi:hypothetical protein